MVKVKNRSNGKQSKFTDAEWARISKDPQWAGVFIEVKEARVPKEVRDLQNKSSNGTQSQNAATAQGAAVAKKDDKKTNKPAGDSAKTGDETK